MTFNLGDLTNTDASNLPNYVIVEFNAVVGSAVADATSLDTTMHGSASGATTPDVHDYSTVQAPVVSLQKVVQGITYNGDGSATVNYVDTVTNTGGGPAYDASLTDPGAGTGKAVYSGTAAIRAAARRSSATSSSIRVPATGWRRVDRRPSPTRSRSRGEVAQR